MNITDEKAGPRHSVRLEGRMSKAIPAIWFPAVRCGSGSDTFTESLVTALTRLGIRAEITWLPHRAEYAPWSVAPQKPPPWANVAHINSWLPPSLVPRSLPVVVTVHSCVHDPALLPYKSRLQDLYHRRWIYPIEAANLKSGQTIVAVSHYTAARTKSLFGLTSIEVIPNGIDTGRFFQLTRPRPHQPFRVLYVGNWSKRKGVELLAPTMRSLGNGFELRYTADRDGKHLQYPLPENCTCLGRLTGKSLVDAYQEADALFLPSRMEGLSLSLLEAMASGLPVIATRVSSFPEVVEHGITGWLCQTHEPEEFVLAFRKLAADTDTWQKMNNEARRIVVERFDEKEMVERYLSIYQSIAA